MYGEDVCLGGEWLDDEKSDVRWGAAGFRYTRSFIQQLHWKSLWIILLFYKMI